jgi:broad specificity phosphatase PhoE
MSAELRRRIEARRRIYLLRHGEVSYFDGRGRPFPPLTVPLNRQGLLQAEAAQRSLEEVPFDRAVATGLPRTEETARIVLGGRPLPIERREELREVAPGKLMDPSHQGFERRFTGALSGPIRRESAFLSGETFGSHQDRVLAGLRALLAEEGWKHLLLVAHGGTNRVILLHALGAELECMGRLEQDAGCINVIDVLEDGALLVRLVNHTPYAPL